MCLGYAGPSKEVTVNASASRQLFDLPEKADERRALDFFASCAAANLSGWLEEGFWYRTVLQLSHGQPAIRHALIALSSAYEQASSSQPMGKAPILLHYNRAIQHLYQQKSGSAQSALIHLSSCLLFTCLEFVHGDSKSAMAHVVSGLHILRAFKDHFDNGPNHHHPDIQTIHDDLAPIFCRLSIFSNLIGEVTPVIHLKSTDTDDLSRFTSLSEARDGLTDLMNDGMRFVWSITPAKYTGTLSTADIIRQVRLELLTSKWYRRFSLLRSHLTSSSPPAPPHSAQTIEQGLAILETHFYMAHTFTALLTSNTECAWDPHFAEFAKIVSVAEDLIVAQKRGRNGNETFSFEAELVSPLYLTALKCRHPRLRRRAVALLERLRRREGVIDSRRAARVARAIIKIEEGGEEGLHGGGEGDAVPLLPAERRRVQFFFEPESVVPDQHRHDNAALQAAQFGAGESRGPCSIAYKTCEGMFLKTRLEEGGPGEAVDMQSSRGGGGGGGSGAPDGAFGGYKEFDIAATRFSQRL
ncbi:hypothetical protein SLS55_002654 [Diplodia seriata]|uniref:C6 zinc finger domain protein n=1 Tax=Diplodia seriata TaxID=420778 RepID=A0ABR3CST8_9PEZI